MLNLLFSLFVACVPPAAQVDSAAIAIVDTAPEESPIHWDECSYRIGEHICNLELTDKDAKSFNLYEHYGRPIVIELVAEWCGVCRHTADQADIFMANYSEHDLLWVTIMIENDEGEAPNVIDMAEWLSLSSTQNSVLLYGSRDLIDPAAEDGFPVSGWPTHVVINRDMQIFHGFAGWSKDYLESKLNEMLSIQQ